MTTKRPGTNWKEDITHYYKYTEGSSEERESVKHAMTTTKNPAVIEQPSDVSFESKVQNSVGPNTPVDLKLFCKNKSAKRLTIRLVVSAQIIRHTGIAFKSLREQKVQKPLPPNGEVELDVVYSSDEFLEHLDDNISCRLSYMAKVIETKQTYADQQICQIRKPELEAELIGVKDKKVKSGDIVKFKFIVPEIKGIPKYTECYLEVDGPIIEEENFKLIDPVPGSSIQKTFKIKKIVNKKRKIRDVVITFNSKQLSGIRACLDLIVTE